MKRILAVVVVLTVVACSGGPPGDLADPAPERTLSPTAPPWAEGWASAFCYAID